VKIDNPYLDEFRAPMSDEERAWYRTIFQKDPDEELNYLRSLGLAARDAEEVARWLPMTLSIQRRLDLVCKYAWSIPNDQAIRAIAELSPIIEIGAGTGYWASLLRAVGAEVVAFDKDPPQPRKTKNTWHRSVSQWTTVLQGDEKQVIAYPHHTLMLSWPPYDDPMALEALRLYEGKRVVYIGEWYGCTADDAFHQALEEHWVETATVRIPHWDTVHDSLMLFERKPT
jgi:hypothetical protein